MTLAFVLRVLEIFGEEADLYGELFWRVGHPDPGLHLYALCNDVFWWGTADAEEITPENLPVLEQALVEVKDLGALNYLPELFAARTRKMRPQRPWYEKKSAEIAALFDACGPERERTRDELPRGDLRPIGDNRRAAPGHRRRASRRPWQPSTRRTSRTRPLSKRCRGRLFGPVGPRLRTFQVARRVPCPHLLFRVFWS